MNQALFSNQRPVLGTTLRSIALALSCSLIVACGGGGGGSDSDDGSNGGGGTPTPSDATGPEVSLVSPSSNSATTSKTIEVTGTASDTGSGVTSVTVNGEPAVSDDGFATWSAIVPVETGLSSLTIVAEDGSANATNLNQNIQVQKLSDIFSSANDLVLNTITEELVISDSSSKQIFKANLSTATLATLSLTSGGVGSNLSRPRETSGGRSPNSALIIDLNESDRNESELIREFNIDTGDISELLNLSSVAGLARVIDIAVNPAGNQIYILSEIENSRNGGALWVHNTLDSSTSLLRQTEISGNSDFSIPDQLAYGTQTDSLYYLDNDELVRYDIAENSLNVVSARGGTLPLTKASDLSVNEISGRAWIVDSVAKEIVEINLDDGERSVLSANESQSGPEFITPSHLVQDTARNRLLVADTGLNLVFSVSLENGAREYFLSNRFGVGPLFSSPVDVDIVISPDSSFAYVTDEDLNAIISVNIETGDRNFVSLSSTNLDEEIGNGDAFESPRSIVVSNALNQAFVTDSELGAIISVELDSGNRSELVLSYEANAINIQKPVGIGFNDQSDELIVSGLFSDSVQSIDTATSSVSLLGASMLNDGNKVQKLSSVDAVTPFDKIYGIDELLKGLVEWDTTNDTGRVISRVFVGAGENFSKPYDLQASSSSPIVYISDANLKAILEVDTTTGNRTVISSADVGSGPEFIHPAGISLHEDSERLFVIDKDAKALYEVSLAAATKGNRTIISR